MPDGKKTLVTDQSVLDQLNSDETPVDNLYPGLDQKLSNVESGGDYTATNPHSTATGKYQFLWGNSPDSGFGEEIKKVTGVKDRSGFLNNPQAQEDFYNYYKNKHLAPAVENVSQFNKDGYSNDQLAMLVHYKGEGGAEEWLRNHQDNTTKNNMSIDQYVGKPEGTASIPHGVPVTDPAILQQLNGDTPAADVSRGTDNNQNNNVSGDTPMQSVVNPNVSVNPNDVKADLAHANDYMHSMLGDDATKPAVAPENHAVAQNAIGSEVQASQDYIKNDANQFFNTIPPAAKSQFMQAGIDPTTVAQKISAPAGGQVELSQYYKARTTILDQQYQQQKSAILANTPTGQENDSEFDAKIAAQKKALADLQAKYDHDNNSIHNAVFNVASLKAVNTDLDQFPDANNDQKASVVSMMKPGEVGAKVQKMMGGPDIANPDPIQKAEQEKIGYESMRYAMADAFAKGNLPVAKVLKQQTDNYNEKLLADNPEYKKKVFATAISKEIDSRANTFKNFLMGTSVNKTYIDQVANGMGIKPEDYKDIQPNDITTDPGAIKKLAGGVLKPIVEIDQSMLNVGGDKTDDFTNFYNNSAIGKSVGWNRNEQNSLELRQSPTVTDTDPTSLTYGQEIPNSKAGNYNLGWNTIGTEVGNGIATIGTMALGSGEIGSALQANKLIASKTIADRVGLGIYSYITGYDNNYQKAKQALGADPGKEADRVGLANVYNLVDALALQILPAKNVADKWIGTEAGKEFVDMVRKKGIDNVTADMAKPYIVRGLTEGGADLTKGVAQGVVNQLGDNVADMAFAPKKYAQTDVPDEIKQAAITGAIQMFIPTVGGGILHAKSAGPMYKNAMFEIGNNPDNFITDIQNKISSGAMDQGEGAERIRAIKSIADIYQKSVPQVSVTNGENLTSEQQKDYGANLIAEKQLQAQQEATQDKVQKEAIESYIKALQSQRGDILHAAGFQPAKEENHISINEVVGKKVLYKGEPSTISVDDMNRVIATNDETGKEYDNIGNATIVGNQSIKNHDIEEIASPGSGGVGASVVHVNDNGQIVVRGKLYSLPEEHGGDPLAAINYHNEPGQKGVPSSVTLDSRSANGGIKKVTFRGNVAEDLMYQLHLQKLAKDNSHADLEKFLNTDQETSDNVDAGRSLQTTESTTTADNGEVSAEQNKNTVAGDLFSSPSKKNDHGKQESEQARNGQNQEVNGSNQSRVGLRDEQAQVEHGNGREIRNEQPGLLNPSDAVGGGEKTAANPFGFVDEEPNQHDLFSQTPLPEKLKQNASTQSEGTQQKGNQQSGGPEHEGIKQTGDQIPATGAESGNSVQPGRTPQQQKEEAVKFFSPPHTEREITESAKVGDKVKQRFQKAEKVLGRKNTKILNDGSEVTGHYVLTTDDAVTPSHNPKTFQTSEGFPLLEDGKNPNDRNYSRKDNSDRVTIRAQSYDGRAAEQIPTVDKNGVVIDGNDRTMSGQLAAKMGTDTKYVDAIKAKADTFGFTPEQIDEMVARGKHPRVIFVTDKVMPYDTHTFSAFNPRTTGKVKTPIEEAVQFGRTIDNGIIDRIGQVMNGFDGMAKFFSNRPASKMVRDVMERAGILNPDNVTGAYRDGKFTNAGKELLQNVMLGKVFSEETLHLLESSPGVREKVVYSMSNIMSIEALGDEYSLKTHMSDALHLKDRVDETLQANDISLTEKEAGLKMLLSQGDMFGAKEFSPEAIGIWHLLEDPTKVAFREFTKEYLKNAKKYTENSGKDIFGQLPPTREQLINNYLKSLDSYEQSKPVRQPAEEVNHNEPPAEVTPQPEQNLFGGGASEPAGSKENVEPGTVEAEKPTPVAAVKAPDEPVVAPESKVFIQPEKKTQAAVGDDQKIIDDYNTAKKQLSDKERKIELMQEEREKLTKSDEPDKGNSLKDLDARLERENAALRSLKNKKRQAELAADGVKSKGLAGAIREAKIAYNEDKKGPKVRTDKDGNEYVVHYASLFDDEVVKKIGVKLYNASLEIAARAVEAGHDIKVAIQKAVDYIHDRHFTSWGEKEFRDNLGEHLEQHTAETLRTKKVADAPLSDDNIKAANHLIETVKDNKNSLQSTITHIDGLPIKEVTKDKIREYVRQRIIDEVHKASGEKMAVKHLKLAGGDYDEALKTMGDEFDTNLMNTTSKEQKENLRSKYAAAKAALESLRTTDRVKKGEIIPNYKAPDLETGPKFKMPQYQTDEKGNLTMKGKTQKAADMTAINFQDKYSRLETAQRNSLVPITHENDAVTAMRLKKSKAWEKINQIRNYVGNVEHIKGSLFDRMKKDGVDLNKMGLYLYAKHAEERNEYNAKLRQKIFDSKVYDLNHKIAEADGHPQQQQRLKTELQRILDQQDSRYALMPDGGSGMTNEQAKEILSEVAADPMKDKYEAYAKEFKTNVIDKILDEKHQSQQISDEDYNHLKNYYQNYVPLKVKDEVLRSESNGEEDNKFFSNSAINGRELYRSKGAMHRTLLDRNNPILQSAVDLEHSMIKGEDNKANIALSNFVKMNPNENVWEIQPAQYETVKDANGNIIKAWENNDTRPNNAIPYYENGKKNYIILRDKGLVQMNKKMGTNGFLKVAGPVSHFIASVNTLSNPEFFLKNVFFDQQDAYMSLLGSDNPELVKKFRKYSPFKVAGEILANHPDSKWGKWVQDWKDHGGEITYLKSFTSEEHAETSGKLFDNYDKTLSASQRKHLLSKAKAFASSLEQTTRVMAYRAAVEGEAAKIAKEKGITQEEAIDQVNRDKAAVISRNATVDFEKKGVYGAYISAFKAFANAGIQGTANLVYLAAKSPRVRKFLGAMVMSGIAEAEIGRLLGNCNPPSSEDCYLGQPDFRKERSFMIPLKPFGGKGYASIPIGRNFGWFNYMGKKLDEYVRGEIHPSEFFGNTLGSMIDYYDPSGGTAPIEQKLVGNLAPAVGWATNKTNYGTPIEPEKGTGKFESENFFPKTPEEFVKASDMIHELTGGNASHPGKVEVSPDKLQFISQSLFGGLGKFAGGTFEAIDNAAKGNAVPANDIPIARTFYRTGNMFRTKKEYYDLADKSKTEILSEPESKKVEDNLRMLVEGNEITSDQADKRWQFIERNQKIVEKEINKREEKGQEKDKGTEFSGGGASEGF